MLYQKGEIYLKKLKSVRILLTLAVCVVLCAGLLFFVNSNTPEAEVTLNGVTFTMGTFTVGEFMDAGYSLPSIAHDMSYISMPA